MTMKRFIQVAAFAIAGAAALQAQASPVNWNFSGHGSFNTTLSGTFTFDADTKTYSNVDLRFSFSVLHFEINSGDETFLEYGIANNTGLAVLTFASPLTDAGGTIGVKIETDEFGVPVFHQGTLTAPTAVVTTPVSEPESLTLAGLGLLLAGAVGKRAKARRAARPS